MLASTFNARERFNARKRFQCPRALSIPERFDAWRRSRRAAGRMKAQTF